MQQRGFTLIELIIVIVILGILAVTAAPKFIDVQSDAQGATLKSVKAALTTGAQLVYAKSALVGEQKTAYAGDATSQVSVNGVDVYTDFGYPASAGIDSDNAKLAAFVDLDLTNDWYLSTPSSSNSTSAGTFVLTPGTTKPTNTSTNTCKVTYTDAANENTPPTVVATITGC
ncbi:prepilin-type N-terminal cleavage/methylation domain-containing protein [Neptunicella marina]|uniref:Prepilin-type N-terminal cleavage/methylation domain-containing protein n=1 Tax=Neptunicella marina TaxID=2125989 RepID=A0A8J6IST9_9ALTE|nr:prepilin-type N-terminal cleavage/methylation domain-containing protein [Neptunicella marina]MBC3766111.1 prepilin-type N-terminal cleavage/methylation domain-containing protein [Neptunicella marina]